MKATQRASAIREQFEIYQKRIAPGDTGKERRKHFIELPNMTYSCTIVSLEMQNPRMPPTGCRLAWPSCLESAPWYSFTSTTSYNRRRRAIRIRQQRPSANLRTSSAVIPSSLPYNFTELLQINLSFDELADGRRCRLLRKGHLPTKTFLGLYRPVRNSSDFFPSLLEVSLEDARNHNFGHNTRLFHSHWWNVRSRVWSDTNR